MAVYHMRAAAGVAVLALSAAGFAEDANPDTKALLDYVKKLEDRVNQLEQERQWPLDQVRSQSTSALEAAVRSVNLSGYMEFQYGVNLRHGGSNAGAAELAGAPSGFSPGTSPGLEAKPKLSRIGVGRGIGEARGDTLNYSLLRGSAPDDNGFSFQNLMVLADKPLTSLDSTGFRIRSEFGMVSRFLNRDANFTDPDHAFDVREAYMSWRACGGFTEYTDLTIGKFDSPFGFEGADNDTNWMVTRDPFFALIKPATHTGVRAVMPWTDCAKTSVYFVNGWDVVRDTGDGKTVILAHEINKLPWLNSTVILQGSYGNEGSVYPVTTLNPIGTPSVPPDGNKTWLVEAIWKGELSKETQLALDAAWAKQENGAASPSGIGADERDFHFVSGLIRHQMSSDMWVAGRLGYHSDTGPAALLGNRAFRGYNASVAVGWNLAQDLTMAVEYRHDRASSDAEPFFASNGGPAGNQDTVVASFVYRF